MSKKNNNSPSFEHEASKQTKIALEKSLTDLGHLDRKFSKILNCDALMSSFFNLLDLLLDPLALIIATTSAILAYAALAVLNIILLSSINTTIPLLVFATTWIISLLAKGLYYLLFK